MPVQLSGVFTGTLKELKRAEAPACHQKLLRRAEERWSRHQEGQYVAQSASLRPAVPVASQIGFSSALGDHACQLAVLTDGCVRQTSWKFFLVV